MILELVSEMILMLVDMDQRKSFTLNKFITGDEKVHYYLEFAERLLSKIPLLPKETVSDVTKRPFLFYLGKFLREELYCCFATFFFQICLSLLV